MKLEEFATAEERTHINDLETTIKELQNKAEFYSSQVESWKNSLYAIGHAEIKEGDKKLLDNQDYKELIKVQGLLTEVTEEYDELTDIIEKRQELTSVNIDLEGKEAAANQKSINAIKGKGNALKENSKSYEDYLAELKKAEAEENRRVSNLRNMGAEISDAEALEAKKDKVGAILTEMSTALNLNTNQIKYLSDNYGYALEGITTDRFSELVKEIELRLCIRRNNN